MSEHHDQAPDRRQLVAARIREARRSRGMDTLEFARTLGVSRREINYLEVGRHQPGLRTLSKIVDLTGKSYEWLSGVEVEEGANVCSTAAARKLATTADSELVHQAAIRTLTLLGILGCRHDDARRGDLAASRVAHHRAFPRRGRRSRRTQQHPNQDGGRHMKPQTRSAVCVVRSADLVQRKTKDGPKNQLEVVTDDGKLQTWNAGLWSAVQPLIGCYAAVEYHDKARPYPGEWLLDQIRPATDSEADAYIAGEAPRLREMTMERAIAAPQTVGSDSTRTESARRATTTVSAHDGGWSGAMESLASGAAAGQGGIRDAQIHAQTACTVAAQLVGDSSVNALDALAYVKTVKALTKVFSQGASDESLADLAEVLGADNLGALAVLNQMDSLASGGEEPAPVEASPSANDNGPRVAEPHVTEFSRKLNGTWVPTRAEREKLLAAGWSEDDLTVSAIASGRGPLGPNDVSFGSPTPTSPSSLSTQAST